MPVDLIPLRIIVVAWYVLVLQPHARHRLQPKPRLDTIACSALDTLLRSPRMCQHTTRLTPDELLRLAAMLHIHADEQASGNWRFRPLHRLMLFLISFGNSSPSRKQRSLIGWAANSALTNWRYHIDQIVLHLDAPDSRTSAAHHRCCCCAPLLTLSNSCAVQLIALQAGRGMSSCTGSLSQQGRRSSQTA